MKPATIWLAVTVAASGLASGSETRWMVSVQEDAGAAASLEDLVLEVGTPIRVVRADGRALDGDFRSVAFGVLSVQTDEEVLALPEDELFQVYRVEKRRGKGALKGLLVGLGITAALGVATMTQATESGEGAIGFGIGLLFAVPISVTVGVIASPDRRELVYQNKGFAPPEERPPPEPPTPQKPAVPEIRRVPQLPPEIPKSFYLGVAGGASYLGGEPLSGTVTEQPGPSAAFSVQGLFRASERWGFGGEVLFTDAGTWTWEQNDRSGTDSRKIVAPGFKVYYFPIMGKNELVLNAGVSAFKQDSHQTVETPDGSMAFSETKLDPYFNAGLSYHRYIHPKLGIGADVQLYTGGNQIPRPLVLFSVSVSFRASPPPPR